MVVHGGSVSRSYPDRVKNYAREQAVRTVREAARHADDVGVPLCVENQRVKRKTQYNTSTPEDLAAFLDAVGLDTDYLGVTLDVGHATASGADYESFVETLGDRIVVAHPHDNDERPTTRSPNTRRSRPTSAHRTTCWKCHRKPTSSGVSRGRGVAG